MSVGIKELCDSFLEHSYRYYIQDSPTVPDSYFDSLCAELSKRSSEIPSDVQHLIDNDALTTASGFHIRINQYPDYIINKCKE